MMAVLIRNADWGDIIDHGCKAIAELDKCSETRGILVQSGACGAVVASMRALAGKATVQASGCSAVYWLARESESNKDRLEAGWCLGCIVTKAMQAFPRDETIQRRGKIAHDDLTLRS